MGEPLSLLPHYQPGHVLCASQVGEGEKLVRALFALARELQPAIIFLGQWLVLSSWPVVYVCVRGGGGSPWVGQVMSRIATDCPGMAKLTS